MPSRIRIAGSSPVVHVSEHSAAPGASSGDLHPEHRAPAGGQGASLALEDAMLVGQFLADRSVPVMETFAKAESVQRLRAEQAVKQAAENDRRQVKELGPFGQWIRDRMFPLFTPVIARQLRRQCTPLEHMCAPDLSEAAYRT